MSPTPRTGQEKRRLNSTALQLCCLPNQVPPISSIIIAIAFNKIVCVCGKYRIGFPTTLLFFSLCIAAQCSARKEERDRRMAIFWLYLRPNPTLGFRPACARFPLPSRSSPFPRSLCSLFSFFPFLLFLCIQLFIPCLFQHYLIPCVFTEHKTTPVAPEQLVLYTNKSTARSTRQTINNNNTGSQTCTPSLDYHSLPSLSLSLPSPPRALIPPNP